MNHAQLILKWWNLETFAFLLIPQNSELIQQLAVEIVSEITMFLGKENMSLCRTCNTIRTKFLIEMITWCKFCKRAHCSHIVGRLTEFGSSLKWGNIYKIKNQTNEFCCWRNYSRLVEQSRLLFQIRSRKLTCFPLVLTLLWMSHVKQKVVISTF